MLWPGTDCFSTTQREGQAAANVGGNGIQWQKVNAESYGHMMCVVPQKPKRTGRTTATWS